MAKPKKPILSKGFGTGKQILQAGLQKAEAQIRKKNWNQALEILQYLAKKCPDEPDVYISQINIFLELGDIIRYQHACEPLLELDPNNADVTIGLAGAYMKNQLPALALQTFRRFLERWPHHKRAADVLENIKTLDTSIAEMAAEMNLTGSDATEIITWHEQAENLLARCKTVEARQLEEKILQHRPDFIPALNRISESYCLEGNITQAIATCQRVLELEPTNYHALSNLCYFFLLNGEVEAATSQANILKNIQGKKMDIWLKKAESFSLLGDHDSVLETMAEVEKTANLESSIQQLPMLYHLAGCAHLRRGNQDAARQYWEKTLKIAPYFSLTRDNLQDLNQPVSKRHSPWPFSFVSWFPGLAIYDLQQALNLNSKVDDREEALRIKIQEYLQQHPQIVNLIPILLDRGDPSTRIFAFRVAVISEDPQILAALKNFALSDRGPDNLRQQATNHLYEKGLLPTGTVRIWDRGEWEDLLIFDCQINHEPVVTHCPEVMELLAQAIKALKQGKSVESEQLLKQALAIEPEDASLLHNLAIAYAQQGREKEADTLTLKIHKKYPDYIFARIAIANKHLENKDIETAEEILTPLLFRRQFHVSEFAASCAAQIQLALAKDDINVARSWLNMWENACPEHPGIGVWKKRLS